MLDLGKAHSLLHLFHHCVHHCARTCQLIVAPIRRLIFRIWIKNPKNFILRLTFPDLLDQQLSRRDEEEKNGEQESQSWHSFNREPEFSPFSLSFNHVHFSQTLLSCPCFLPPSIQSLHTSFCLLWLPARPAPGLSGIWKSTRMSTTGPRLWIVEPSKPTWEILSIKMCCFYWHLAKIDKAFGIKKAFDVSALSWFSFVPSLLLFLTSNKTKPSVCGWGECA